MGPPPKRKRPIENGRSRREPWKALRGDSPRWPSNHVAVGGRSFPETRGPIAAETAADGATATNGAAGGKGTVTRVTGRRRRSACPMSKRRRSRRSSGSIVTRTAALRKEMMSGRRELRKLIRRKPDEAAIREQVKNAPSTGGNLAVDRAKMFQEVRAVPDAGADPKSPAPCRRSGTVGSTEI